MEISRVEKMKSLLKEAAAQFTEMESNRTSLVTITDINTSKDFKRSTIFFTTLPEDKELEVLEFLKRRRSDFREFIKKQLPSMRIVPFFDFEIDKGEKNRQRIEEITNNIEA